MISALHPGTLHREPRYHVTLSGHRTEPDVHLALTRTRAEIERLMPAARRAGWRIVQRTPA